jgi:hypothetical protein
MSDLLEEMLVQLELQIAECEALIDLGRPATVYMSSAINKLRRTACERAEMLLELLR